MHGPDGAANEGLTPLPKGGLIKSIGHKGLAANDTGIGEIAGSEEESRHPGNFYNEPAPYLRFNGNGF